MNNTYGVLPTPNRNGYEFKGWYTSTSGGIQVTENDIMGDTNTTIYAQWKLPDKTVTLTTQSNWFDLDTSGYDYITVTSTPTTTLINRITVGYSVEMMIRVADYSYKDISKNYIQVGNTNPLSVTINVSNYGYVKAFFCWASTDVDTGGSGWYTTENIPVTIKFWNP